MLRTSDFVAELEYNDKILVNIDPDTAIALILYTFMYKDDNDQVNLKHIVIPKLRPKLSMCNQDLTFEATFYNLHSL